MLKYKIESKISSMSKRKLLFIVGEHLTGKTLGVKGFLEDRFGDLRDNYYIDLGLHLQKEIRQEQIDTYSLFPHEFASDSVHIVNELLDKKQENLLIIDHCEWLFAEKQTEWLKKLMRETEEKRTIVVVVPEEYKVYVPSHLYSVIEWGGGSL
jgi:hypothetical protein